MSAMRPPRQPRLVGAHVSQHVSCELRRADAPRGRQAQVAVFSPMVAGRGAVGGAPRRGDVRFAALRGNIHGVRREPQEHRALAVRAGACAALRGTSRRPGGTRTATAANYVVTRARTSAARAHRPQRGRRAPRRSACEEAHVGEVREVMIGPFRRSNPSVVVPLARICAGARAEGRRAVPTAISLSHERAPKHRRASRPSRRSS